MADLRSRVREKPTFRQERFLEELDRLRRGHGLLAITAHVMVPLDARHHHVVKAQTGVDQISLDQLDIAVRYPDELDKVRP